MKNSNARGFNPGWKVSTIALVLGWSVPVSAADSGFRPDSVPIWVARTNALANVAFDNDPNGRDTGATMIAACKGLQGEQMDHEYGKVPAWAIKGQLYICEAYKGWAKPRLGSGECKLLQQGLDFLGKANPATDPPEVVASAAAATATGNIFLKTMRSMKHMC